jgi:pimeloyl-ACP methyl ester carboxylesterase
VREDTAAAEAGFQAGDRILKINGQILSDPVTFERLYQKLRGGERVRFTLERGNSVFEREIIVPPLPKEELPGVEILYASVQSPHGYRLRTIVTRPAGAEGRLPGVFLAPWLSCSSVESPLSQNEGLMRRLAQESWLATMRVERPGLGDSEGPPCSEVDFVTELAGFRAALRSFKEYAFVDPDRIVILGISNGGGYAPLVGEGEKVAGYVVNGGWLKTWFEHMLEIERRRLALLGHTPGEISERIRGYAEFYTEYLIRQQSPIEVIRQKPHLASLWYDEPAHQYGRPASYYHQLQRLNLEAAWQQVAVPTLALFGEHDWIMSREDHEAIAALVNRNRPGAARFVLLPKADHDLMVHETMKESFEGSSRGRFAEEVIPLVTNWLKQVVGPRPTR